MSRGDLDRGLALADRLSARVGVWVPQSTLLSVVVGSLALVLHMLGSTLTMIEPARSVLLLGRAITTARQAADPRRLPLAFWCSSS